MSRTDKRTGRVKYNKDEGKVLVLLKKALFGKDWDDKIADPLLVLFLCSLNHESVGTMLNPKEKPKTLMVYARKTLNICASLMVGQGDGDALQKLGRMINCIKKRHCDLEAVEICLAYLKFLIINKAFPSGKDLAIVIDEVRKGWGYLPSKKTHDAIRERALRLGLKLKGKRNKNK